MLSKLIIGGALMGLCVTIHAGGLMWALRWLNRRRGPVDARFWVATRILIGVAGWSVVLHLAEIAIWAIFYAWTQAMPDLPSAFYFSTVTYTTTGYGDLVLPERWRLVGGIEALTGILMCGLSTGLFFAVFGKLIATHSGHDPAQAKT